MVEYTFEQALSLLEQNAESLAAPELSLEDSIRLYAESVRLAEFCQKSLEQAKLRVETLEREQSVAQSSAGGSRKTENAQDAQE